MPDAVTTGILCLLVLLLRVDAAEAAASVDAAGHSLDRLLSSGQATAAASAAAAEEKEEDADVRI